MHPAQPHFWRGCGVAAHSGQAKQFVVYAMGSWRDSHSTSSVLEATQAIALALVGQPWSYLRLKAYSFFWLCEGAYGAFGGSVQNDGTQGLTHRLILTLDPKRCKNRLTNHRVDKPGFAWIPWTLKLLAISDVPRRSSLLFSKVLR